MLGGFIQINLEDGDASAFDGRFGQTAMKDRFRLRRARINLTGDFAEQFDFKVEGDFAERWHQQQPHRFFGHRHLANWHQFPGAQIKIGQYKAPFGLEQLTPDTTLFTYRAQLSYRRNHARPADRRRTLGKAVHQHLA